MTHNSLNTENDLTETIWNTQETDTTRDCKHCSAAYCMLCVSEVRVVLPCPHSFCWDALEQKHLTLVCCSWVSWQTGCTGIKCSPQCCWSKLSPLTTLADGTALIRLILWVHTLCLRAGCHRAQHLTTWLTTALLTRRHLESREEIVINTLCSHTGTHAEKQQLLINFLLSLSLAFCLS